MPFEPDPDPTSPPAVYQCQVLRDPNSVSICRRDWDRKHTVLGFAICAECYEEVRRLEP